MKLGKLEITENQRLAPFTSYKVGGKADYFCEVEDTDGLKQVVDWWRKEGKPFFILGKGTNLLIRDGGIRGLVIKLGGEFKKVVFTGSTAVAGAGLEIVLLARHTQDQGLAGLEFLSGIPGSLGGALIMNAGAHGHSIGDYVQSVLVLEDKGVLREISKEEAGFKYRGSALAGKVILSATLLLAKGDPREIGERGVSFSRLRAQTQPLGQPSAGSVFKNPEGDHAARLIEAAGLKGLAVGGAQVSEKHANFIVNTGQATARDILVLIDKIQQEVKTKTGKELELEIKVVGVDA